jgi:urease accessory protein
MPNGLALALVGVFAIFHGHAHGAEIPVGATAGAYVAGFTLATAAIHASGVSVGVLFARLAGNVPLLRMAGGAIVVAGCILALAR